MSPLVPKVRSLSDLPTPSAGGHAASAGPAKSRQPERKMAAPAGPARPWPILARGRRFYAIHWKGRPPRTPSGRGRERAQPAESFAIVSQGDELPLAADLFQPAQQELAKPEHV